MDPRRNAWGLLLQQLLHMHHRSAKIRVRPEDKICKMTGRGGIRDNRVTQRVNRAPAPETGTLIGAFLCKGAQDAALGRVGAHPR